MEAKRPTILQSVLIAFVLLIIIVILSLLLAAIKLPAWPFIFFLFSLTTLAAVDRKNWVETLIGGLIGLIIGMSQIIGAALFGETVGLIILAVSVIIILTLVVDGRFKYTNKTCLFILTAVSSFSAFIKFEEVLPIIASFLVGAALFGVIILISEANAKKKATKSAA